MTKATKAEQTNLLNTYWSFYWRGELEACAALVDFMRSVGIDTCHKECNGETIRQAADLVERTPVANSLKVALWLRSCAEFWGNVDESR